ncbi:30S ribosomal protein S20 [Novipirellula aureliae]|uniref:Small ribosomal subunit protein bS20 n=1 Tax=Novipirellula aureliae TaxID=2527966 RepID=A0A5C6EAV4_9BACT|nr:30S ribosomal protein S20 [Novipirellula aureliae]TWU45624.1 30S ribosomal protein S20 [Novipirellula aureliae]
MPNTQSAKKRLRQSEKLRLRNRATRSNMRSTLRNVREAVKEGDTDKMQAAFRLAVKKLDKAASKNIIHRNAAARTKSRLSKLVKAAGCKA